MGPTTEEALVRIDHRLYLEPEGVSDLKSLIPHLIDGVASHVLVHYAGGSSSSARPVGFDIFDFAFISTIILLLSF